MHATINEEIDMKFLIVNLLPARTLQIQYQEETHCIKLLTLHSEEMHKQAMDPSSSQDLLAKQQRHHYVSPYEPIHLPLPLME